MKRAYLIMVYATLILNSYCQEPVFTGRPSNQRALKAYERAIHHYRLLEYPQAISFAKKAVKHDSRFIEATILLAEIYQSIEKFDSAVLYYRNAISTKPSTYPKLYLTAGDLLFRMGKYAESLELYSAYQGLPPLAVIDSMAVRERIERALFALAMLTNPREYSVKCLDENINTSENEYINAITLDGKLMIFTRKTRSGNKTSFEHTERIFYSDWSVDGWLQGKVMLLNDAIQIEGGAFTLSPDGKYIFFTACHRPAGYGSCDLYYSLNSGGKWMHPVNLGPVVNSSKWDSQPCFSADGRTLFFSSNRPGGQGGADLWKTVLNDDGIFGKPENLGPVINTDQDEMAPFMHPDGRSFYFSSSGHYGMGALDLFVSKPDENGNWSKPENLGYPINTFHDEINILVDPTGRDGYFSAKRAEGKGGYDVYHFNMPEVYRPNPVTYIKGTVVDDLSQLPVQASITLINVDNEAEKLNTFSDEINGSFLAALPTGGNFALHINKPGYLLYSMHLPKLAPDTSSAISSVLIRLKPIIAGNSIVLENVFFRFNSSELESSSKAELDQLVRFLNQNPGVKIELIGHTDNIGSTEYNLTLSVQRAKAVFDYLRTAGIDQERMRYSGRGDTQPRYSNETEIGRKKNRRTEFIILR